MNAFNRSALKAYGHVQTDVAAEYADSHSLVSMLFNGAIDNLCKAEYNFETGNIAARRLPKRRRFFSDSARRWITAKGVSWPDCSIHFTTTAYVSLLKPMRRASRLRYRKSKG